MEMDAWITEACVECSSGLVEGQFILDMHACWMWVQGAEEEACKTGKKSEKTRRAWEDYEKEKIITK